MFDVSTPSDVDFQEIWPALKETVQRVISLGDITTTDWADAYMLIFSLKVAEPEPFMDKLYSETEMFLKEHVQTHYKQIGKRKINLLKAYFKGWTQFSQGLIYLDKLYFLLNEEIIENQNSALFRVHDARNKMEIGQLGLKIWEEQIVLTLQEDLVRHLLEEFRQDRIGGSCHMSPSIIHGVISSFVECHQKDLQLYQKIFQEPFLEATAEHYKRQIATILQECNHRQYMERITLWLDQETLRSTKFLHLSSFDKFRECCIEHMVNEQLVFLVSECRTLIVQERSDDLCLLYNLLKPTTNGLTAVIKEFQDHVTCQLRSVLPQVASTTTTTTDTGMKMTSSKQFVENLLGYHTKYNEMIANIFNGDPHFKGALDKAYCVVINERNDPRTPCRSPEMLARYCDNLLKKCSKVKESESEREEKVLHSLTLFQYIQDKDLFQVLCEKMLAQRLINQQSLSMDTEEAMINKLRLIMGYEYANKLRRMITDKTLSDNLTNTFNNYLRLDEHVQKVDMNFSVDILQTGSWPCKQNDSSYFAIPEQIATNLQRFERFYQDKYTGRRLTWLHHLCKGELKLTYLDKPYLITMQASQMAILLLFMTTNSFTSQQLERLLEMNEELFNRNVTSLVACKLLTSSTPTIEPTSILSLNMEFSNKRTKFNINGPLQREPVAQQIRQTQEQIDRGRKYTLDAAIVRIMKSRKKLVHNELIQEVISQSKKLFAPSISMIKKCIDGLIYKEYLARTPDRRDEYIYVA